MTHLQGQALISEAIVGKDFLLSLDDKGFELYWIILLKPMLRAFRFCLTCHWQLPLFEMEKRII